MEKPPVYTPTRFYAWTQRKFKLKRTCVWIGGSYLALTGLIMLVAQIAYTLPIRADSQRTWFLLGSGGVLLGVILIFGMLWAPRLALTIEGRHMQVYWTLVKAKSMEISTKEHTASHIELGYQSGVVGLSVQLDGRPGIMAVFVPLTEAAWMSGNGHPTRVIFPEARYAVNDSGTVEPRCGGQVILVSPVNQLRLQTPGQLSTATSSVTQLVFKDL